MSQRFKVSNTIPTGPVKKVFWVVAFCATMIAFVWNVSATIVTFADFPVSVSITLFHETELIFPAVTICNMSPVRRSSVESSATFQEASEAAKKRRRRKKRSVCTFDNAWKGFKHLVPSV